MEARTTHNDVCILNNLCTD